MHRTEELYYKLLKLSNFRCLGVLLSALENPRLWNWLFVCFTLQWWEMPPEKQPCTARELRERERREPRQLLGSSQPAISLLAAWKLLSAKQFLKTSHHTCPAGRQREFSLNTFKSWDWLGWTDTAVAQAGLPQVILKISIWPRNPLNDAAEPLNPTCYQLLRLHWPCRKQRCRVAAGISALRCCWAKCLGCSGCQSIVRTLAPASAYPLQHCIAWHWHTGQCVFYIC